MIKGKECWDILALKVQCHEIFDHFFALNIRPGPHMNGRKRFRELFSFCESNSRKPVSAWSTTTLTPCQRSQQLQGHGPSVFNHYANMCQLSQRLRGHTGNYFSLEKVKNQQKSNLIFSKICCPRSRWLRWHPIEYCISVKTKNFAKPFLPVYMIESFKPKKTMVENLVKLSL